MSEEITGSVSEVFTGVAQQNMPLPFLFETSEISYLKNDMKSYERDIEYPYSGKDPVSKKRTYGWSSNQERIVIAEFYWVRLAIEYILHPRVIKSDYPFVLPYLELMNRIVEIFEMFKKIVIVECMA